MTITRGLHVQHLFGSAFWGIVAGLLALLVLRPRRPA